MVTQIAYSQKFNRHNSISHPENAERLNVIIKEIKHSPIVDKLEFVEPELINEDLLHSIHTKEMINNIKHLSTQNEAWIDFDTYVSNLDYETARLAAGSVVLLSNNVMKNLADNAFALVRPPGHHATKNRSMGFCLFNNVALAANEITKQGKKVLIFDLDVHHGNGTQDIFYDRKDVLYQSFHLSPHYPGTGNFDEIGTGEGEGYTINAPLGHGNGNNAVKKLLNNIFLPVAEQFKPDMILVSCGYDSHHADMLGGLKLTADFFGEIIGDFQKIQPKIVCTLEGGYNLSWIGKCIVSQLGKMVSQPVSFKDDSYETEQVGPVINSIKNEVKEYWDL